MRKTGVFLAALLLAVAAALPAHARTFTGGDWAVTATAQEGLQSNFKTSDIDDLIFGMQPGDEVIVTLALRNASGGDVNWYMSNKVLRSLEDSRDTASGGAYTYRLVYTDPDGTRNTLFDSDTVGGETIGAAGEGLNAATSGLKDYFYLDAMADGESGSITLTVALDGETQGNGYQDTLADLQMQFAAELLPAPHDQPGPGAPDTDSQTGTTPGTTPGIAPGTAPLTVAKTGDADMTPYYAAAAISGGLLLAYALYSRNVQRRTGAHRAKPARTARRGRSHE